MATKSNVLGVDAGSVSISIIVVGPERDVILPYLKYPGNNYKESQYKKDALKLNPKHPQVKMRQGMAGHEIREAIAPAIMRTNTEVARKANSIPPRP